MKNKRKLFLILLLNLFFCQKKEEIYIQGWISKMEFTKENVKYFREVWVYNYRGFKMIPKVFINDTLLQLRNEPFTYAYYGNYSPFFGNQKYKLRVEHYDGIAFSEVYMPKEFEILYPKEETVIEKNYLPFKIFWQKSEGAEWYEVVFNVEYDYFLPNGEEEEFVFSLDTVLKDTFLIIDGKRIFPEFVDEIISGEGNITVYSGTGPALRPGEKGNVKGLGYGFFNALYSPEDRIFYIEAEPKVKRKFNNKQKILERFKNR
ncbi:MAG: hypothetical protein N2323_01785 [candidate division WOR-3 bacterium]|nr:hypothetical protein [candidate division WOR-3 bacterium]MCX7836678.1 hypothetical protein [candidate division WOR-3 bacterium]MDW8113681.1 hypothetical protein [candidate division WOR-3 bacterium]